MDEKEYKEAVDNIKASEELKRKTLAQMKNDNKPKVYLKVISAVAVVMVVFAVTFTGIKLNDKLPNNKKEDTIVATNNEKFDLPTFESKDELKDYLKEKEDKYSYSRYESKGSMILDDFSEDSIESSSETSMTQNESTSIGSNDYSKTNNQVDGVEEADIIKTDGKYIYYIKGKYGNTEVLIIDANNLKIVDRIDDFDKISEEVNPIDMYITKNKLIIIASVWKDHYLYDNDLVCALIYDISDIENVEYERQIGIDGDYISSRMIDDNLYFITEKNVYFYYDEDIKDRDIIPYYIDTVKSKKEREVGLDHIYYFKDSEETSYVNIVTVNIESDNEACIETFLGASSEIYSSEDYLYLTKENYNYYYRIGIEETTTEIYKFELGNGKVVYTAKGEVKGTILNQFSMDEYKGNLRIATTSYNRNYETENNVYVLDEDLNQIGKLEHLAEDEKIYSVRFIGKVGYVVTFKQVDPLFVIDLSDGENPEVKGKLKIPGYSSYLHPYDETHIIGIGRNTENTEYGSTVNTNMKMSMFDVSDLEDPKEMFSVSIGGKGSSSEILNNHKALFFNKEKDLIGFPITIYDNNDYYSYRTRMQGAIIYEIDLGNKEFKEKGTISMKKASNGYYSYDYDRQIRRIIYIGDKIYAISDALMKVVNIDTLEEVNELEF